MSANYLLANNGIHPQSSGSQQTLVNNRHFIPNSSATGMPVSTYSQTFPHYQAVAPMDASWVHSNQGIYVNGVGKVVNVYPSGGMAEMDDPPLNTASEVYKYSNNMKLSGSSGPNSSAIYHAHHPSFNVANQQNTQAPCTVGTGLGHLQQTDLPFSVGHTDTAQCIQSSNSQTAPVSIEQPVFVSINQTGLIPSSVYRDGVENISSDCAAKFTSKQASPMNGGGAQHDPRIIPLSNNYPHSLSHTFGAPVAMQHHQHPSASHHAHQFFASSALQGAQPPPPPTASSGHLSNLHHGLVEYVPTVFSENGGAAGPYGQPSTAMFASFPAHLMDVGYNARLHRQNVWAGGPTDSNSGQAGPQPDTQLMDNNLNNSHSGSIFNGRLSHGYNLLGRNSVVGQSQPLIAPPMSHSQQTPIPNVASSYVPQGAATQLAALHSGRLGGTFEMANASAASGGHNVHIQDPNNGSYSDARFPGGSGDTMNSSLLNWSAATAQHRWSIQQQQQHHQQQQRKLFMSRFPPLCTTSANTTPVESHLTRSGSFFVDPAYHRGHQASNHQIRLSDESEVLDSSYRPPSIHCRTKNIRLGLLGGSSQLHRPKGTRGITESDFFGSPFDTTTDKNNNNSNNQLTFDHLLHNQQRLYAPSGTTSSAGFLLPPFSLSWNNTRPPPPTNLDNTITNRYAKPSADQQLFWRNPAPYSHSTNSMCSSSNTHNFPIPPGSDVRRMQSLHQSQRNVSGSESNVRRLTDGGCFPGILPDSSSYNGFAHGEFNPALMQQSTWASVNCLLNACPTRILISSALVGAVIGRGGKTVRLISSKTGTQIDFKPDTVAFSQFSLRTGTRLSSTTAHSPTLPVSSSLPASSTDSKPKGEIGESISISDITKSDVDENQDRTLTAGQQQVLETDVNTPAVDAKRSSINQLMNQSQLVLLVGSRQQCSAAVAEILAVCFREAERKGLATPCLGLLVRNRVYSQLPLGRSRNYFQCIQSATGARVSVTGTKIRFKSQPPTDSTSPSALSDQDADADRILVIRGRLSAICSAEAFISDQVRLTSAERMLPSCLWPLLPHLPLSELVTNQNRPTARSLPSSLSSNYPQYSLQTLGTLVMTIASVFWPQSVCSQLARHPAFGTQRKSSFVSDRNARYQRQQLDAIETNEQGVENILEGKNVENVCDSVDLNYTPGHLELAKTPDGGTDEEVIPTATHFDKTSDELIDRLDRFCTDERNATDHEENLSADDSSTVIGDYTETAVLKPQTSTIVNSETDLSTSSTALLPSPPSRANEDEPETFTTPSKDTVTDHTHIESEQSSGSIDLAMATTIQQSLVAAVGPTAWMVTNGRMYVRVSYNEAGALIGPGGTRIRRLMQATGAEVHVSKNPISEPYVALIQKVNHNQSASSTEKFHGTESVTQPAPPVKTQSETESESIEKPNQLDSSIVNGDDGRFFKHSSAFPAEATCLEELSSVVVNSCSSLPNSPTIELSVDVPPRSVSLSPETHPYYPSSSSKQSPSGTELNCQEVETATIVSEDPKEKTQLPPSTNSYRLVTLSGPFEAQAIAHWRIFQRLQSIRYKETKLQRTTVAASATTEDDTVATLAANTPMKPHPVHLATLLCLPYRFTCWLTMNNSGFSDLMSSSSPTAQTSEQSSNTSDSAASPLSWLQSEAARCMHAQDAQKHPTIPDGCVTSTNAVNVLPESRRRRKLLQQQFRRTSQNSNHQMTFGPKPYFSLPTTSLCNDGLDELWADPCRTPIEVYADYETTQIILAHLHHMLALWLYGQSLTHSNYAFLHPSRFLCPPSSRPMMMTLDSNHALPFIPRSQPTSQSMQQHTNRFTYPLTSSTVWAGGATSSGSVEPMLPNQLSPYHLMGMCSNKHFPFPNDSMGAVCYPMHYMGRHHPGPMQPPRSMSHFEHFDFASAYTQCARTQLHSSALNRLTGNKTRFTSSFDPSRTSFSAFSRFYRNRIPGVSVNQRWQMSHDYHQSDANPESNTKKSDSAAVDIDTDLLPNTDGNNENDSPDLAMFSPQPSVPHTAPELQEQHFVHQPFGLTDNVDLCQNQRTHFPDQPTRLNYSPSLHSKISAPSASSPTEVNLVQQPSLIENSSNNNNSDSVEVEDS